MLDRKTPPPFVHTTSFDLIKPKRTTLSNGIEVFVIPGGDQEVIKVELIFRAGRWFEHKTGAAHFAANLLSKGTRLKNSFQIAQIFDRYGAHVEIQPSLDYVSVAIYGLTKFIAPVMELLMEIVSDAAFPEKEIEQSKSIYIQNLKVNEEKTSYLASKSFRKKLFGESHPYGKELEEHEVKALIKTDLSTHYNNTFRQLTVFVSGKIDSSAENLIYENLSSYRTGEPHADEQRSLEAHPFHERIEKEGSVQSSIRAGKISIQRNQPDYFEAVFACHILGGYFGSRLMKNIREEKGLTYGIYASLHPMQKASYFVIGTDVNKENIDLTLDEIRKELKILRTEKISADELYTSKNHFIGSLQSEITTPFAHADKIKTIFLSSLPKDFYQQMIMTIDKITPEKIIAITEKHFHEDTLNEVTVG
jgi:predicted Zn-dependent peptidase